jgi:peptide deformylase
MITLSSVSKHSGAIQLLCLSVNGALRHTIRPSQLLVAEVDVDAQEKKFHADPVRGRTGTHNFESRC